MTTPDQAMDLLRRADPARRTAATRPAIRASQYLDHLERRSNDMTMHSIDDTTATAGDGGAPGGAAHSGSTRRRWLLGAAAAAVIALGAGLLIVGSDDDEPAPVDQPPSTDSPPTATVPAVPVPISRGGLSLNGGWSYVVTVLEPQASFTIPSDQAVASWSVLAADTAELLMLANDVSPDVRPDQEPSLELAPVVPGATADDVASTVERFADERSTLVVERTTAEIAGREVIALRGENNGPPVDVPTSDSTGFFLPPGKQFVAYVLETDDRVVVARVDADPADFDAGLARALPVIESLEFG